MFSLAPPYHPENSLSYRMNQTLTTPHCLWLGFINQHLHYDSELDSIADIHNRCYNSISVHFSLFIIKTKHIQNSPRLSLYHSYFLSHLNSSYSATIIVSSSSILFCNVLNLLYSKLPYWTTHFISSPCYNIYIHIPVDSHSLRSLQKRLRTLHFPSNCKCETVNRSWMLICTKWFTFHEYHRFSKVSNWQKI